MKGKAVPFQRFCECSILNLTHGPFRREQVSSQPEFEILNLFRWWSLMDFELRVVVLVRVHCLLNNFNFMFFFGHLTIDYENVLTPAALACGLCTTVSEAWPG